MHFQLLNGFVSFDTLDNLNLAVEIVQDASPWVSIHMSNKNPQYLGKNSKAAHPVHLNNLLFELGSPMSKLWAGILERF